MDFAQMKRQRQDKFIETRTKIEQEVDSFLKSISEMDEDLRKRCNYNPQYTARTLLPALWSEPFDEDVYKVQLAKVNQYVAAVVALCDAMDAEAIKCLQQ